MRAAGVPRLIILGAAGGPLADAEQVDAFSAAVPDKSEHLDAFCKAFRTPTLGGLVERLHYKQPLELLSMWACLCLAAQLQQARCVCTLWLCVS